MMIMMMMMMMMMMMILLSLSINVMEQRDFNISTTPIIYHGLEKERKPLKSGWTS